MKKIIAAIDGLKYSESTASYAVYLAKQMNAHLVGIMLDDFTYTSYKIYDLVSEGEPIGEKRIKWDDKDKETREESTARFENACQKAGVNYSVHHDRNIAMQELLHESIYADLLIINSRETLTHYQENAPTRFVRELLSEVQCPVLVVPDRAKPIEDIVLLYDGGPTSVYAIKTFSYLLPSLKHLDTEVISVKDLNLSLHVPDNHLMKEFMKRHYPKATYTVLKGMPETEIVNHLRANEKNALIVLGAYRRGAVSRWFRTSMADILLQDLRMPLFIAHNK